MHQANNSGHFTYYATSFELRTTTGNLLIVWDEIQSIFGYKLDQLTTDVVCLDIFLINSQCIHLHEELPGWYKFTQQLSKQLPTITPGWEVAITFPAFATNFTLLYSKANQGEAQATANHYH